MKYVMVVIYLAMGADGELKQTKFEMDFDNRTACFAAIEETETKVMSRVETRALTLSCRPKNSFDTTIAWADYMEDTQRVAAE
jgi:hypothetical protein